MTDPAISTPGTRLLALGSAPLMEAFALLGFEIWPDATTDQVENLLADLSARRQRALVLLEQDLARDWGTVLHRVRGEDPRIVVVEIPPLHAPDSYHPQVEDLVARVLGPSALEPLP